MRMRGKKGIFRDKNNLFFFLQWCNHILVTAVVYISNFAGRVQTKLRERVNIDKNAMHYFVIQSYTSFMISL